MKRRWFIRLCFIVPIVLCVVGWGWSVRHYAAVSYAMDHAHGGLFARLGTNGGTVWLICGKMVTVQSGWFCIFEDSGETRFWPESGQHAYLGFGLHRSTGYLGEWTWEAEVPYWVLVLLFGLMLFFVWRKTRPKPDPATAFPVEAKSEGA